MANGTFQVNTKIVMQLFWEEVNIVSANQDTMAAILDLEFLQKVKTLFKDLLENISMKSWISIHFWTKSSNTTLEPRDTI